MGKAGSQQLCTGLRVENSIVFLGRCMCEAFEQQIGGSQKL